MPIEIDGGDPSDRMGELGRGLSAWLSELYSGAPSGLEEGAGPRIRFFGLSGLGLKTTSNESSFLNIPS